MRSPIIDFILLIFFCLFSFHLIFYTKKTDFDVVLQIFFFILANIVLLSYGRLKIANKRNSGQGSLARNLFQPITEYAAR